MPRRKARRPDGHRATGRSPRITPLPYGRPSRGAADSFRSSVAWHGVDSPKVVRGEIHGCSTDFSDGLVHRSRTAEPQAAQGPRHARGRAVDERRDDAAGHEAVATAVPRSKADDGRARRGSARRPAPRGSGRRDEAGGTRPPARGVLMGPGGSVVARHLAGDRAGLARRRPPSPPRRTGVGRRGSSGWFRSSRSSSR